MQLSKTVIFLGCIIFIACKRDKGLPIQIGNWDVTVIQGFYEDGILHSSDTSFQELRLNSNSTGERIKSGNVHKITEWKILSEGNEISIIEEVESSGIVSEIEQRFDIIFDEQNKQEWQNDDLRTYLPSAGKVFDELRTWHLERID